MKTSTILIVLLLAFATKTSLLALAKTPMLDFDGDKVETGVDYYVFEGIGGGGLYMIFDPVQTCPEIVVQHQSFETGLWVILSNMDGTNGIVYENTNVTISFPLLRLKYCHTSTIWQVVNDEFVGKDLVTLGGIKGKSPTMFTLKKHGFHAYKFQHNGNDIGKYYDESHELIRLAVDNEYPWGWVFIKANKSKIIKQVVNV